MMEAAENSEIEKKTESKYEWLQWKEFSFVVRPLVGGQVYVETLQRPQAFEDLNGLTIQRRAYRFSNIEELKQFINALTIAVRAIKE
jgi:hypothetical protein